MNIYTQLRNAVPIQKAADQLGLKEMTAFGPGLFGNCPTGHASARGFSFGLMPDRNVFFCLNCGVGGNVIDLVQLVKAFNYEESVRWLIEIFMPEMRSVLETGLEPPPPSESEGFYQRAFLYELVFQKGYEMFYESEIGRKTQARFAAQRGYLREILKKTEWIYYPTEKEIRSLLVQEFPETHPLVFGTPKNSFEDKLPLQGAHGDRYRLAFPYRDRNGLITGFVKRSAIRDVRDKWDFVGDIQWNDLFGLKNCSESDSVMILESFPAAMYLPAMGYTTYCTLGIGLRDLTRNHVLGLVDRGVRNVILFFNNPRDEREEQRYQEITQNALRLLREQHMHVFVVDPNCLEEYHDPEDYILGDKIREQPPRGLTAFGELLNTWATKASTWYAQEKIKLWHSKGPGDQKKMLADLVDYRKTIPDVMEISEFDKVLKKALNLSDRAYLDMLQQHKSVKAQIVFQESYFEILREGMKQSGSYSEVSSIKSKLDNLIARFDAGGRWLGSALSDRIHRKYHADKTRTEEDMIGLPLRRFQSIAQPLHGLQPGLYIIAANAGFGKTAFMSNIFWDLVQNNEQSTALFISMDEDLESMVERFIGCHIGINPQELKYSQTGPKQAIKDKAYQDIIELAKQERIVIMDLTEIGSLARIISAIDSISSDSGCVFIDGINHLVPMMSNSSAGVNPVYDIGFSLKSLALNKGMPIIVSCPLTETRESDIRDKVNPPTQFDVQWHQTFVEPASIVWLLYPENAMDFRDKNDPAPTLILECVKNKLTFRTPKYQLQLMRFEGMRLELADLPDDDH